ncbi:sarcosine oxidase subunit gamma [Piscinibacter defluvii]|uniref:sarcosine oxidase subunit gamma n=1 Tax=Piscinibacter defluvii TaxID=1796922 RepID=UPI0013E2D810|nr:sarcosine oxidase subunit gamma family protein [Piscinibacter defluvii]
MLETLQRAAPSGTGPRSGSAVLDRALLAGWREGLAVVNLRGDAADAAFRAAASRALGLALPVQPCTSTANGVSRVVWAGPDDWFVIGPKGQAEVIESQLRTALGGMHHAITDVSSGYTVVQLGGAAVRDVLAQGCPLDLHPRVFKPGACAGSHFFKASIWLWQTDEAPTYEALVRRSFMGYFWLMLERSTQECGLVTRRFA